MRTKKRPQQLSWLQDLFGRDVRVTAVGGGRALVENHAGIVEYGSERILLRCARQMVAINGEGLTLKEVRKDALIAAGAIRSVEFLHDSPSH